MKNSYRKFFRKGFSITEMSVVLALISIVSLLVVSFTAMMHVRSISGATKNRVEDDLKLSKILVESFINTVTNTYDAEVFVTSDKKGLTATIDGVVYKTTFGENELKATLPDGKVLSCPIGEITELEFDEMKRKNGEEILDAIWFCTAKYSLPKNESEYVTEETTFSVNPHIDDIITGELA